MKYLIILILSLFVLSASASHMVYVIHGYGSSKLVMCKINKQIKKEGFNTTNYGYNSIVKHLDILGGELYKVLKNSGYDTVSFVTHSMGALVVRSMLNNITGFEQFPLLYRIIMIAPPNKGADIADLYGSNGIIGLFLGPNISLMQTNTNSYANNLPVPVNSEIGIITGARGNTRGYNHRIKGDNDGRIKPEHTNLGNEKENIVVYDEHTLLTQNAEVIKLVIRFLVTGKFE